MTAIFAIIFIVIINILMFFLTRLLFNKEITKKTESFKEIKKILVLSLVLNMLLNFLLYLQYQASLQFLSYVLLFTILILCSVIDFKYRIIPNVIIFPGFIFALIISLFSNHISFSQSLSGFAFGFIPFLLIFTFLPGAIGGGDVKLIGMIGSFLGWHFIPSILLIACLLSVFINLILIFLKKVTIKSYFAFAPYLSIATYVVILDYINLNEIINMIIFILDKL
ncbi:MAG: prepilin peptidase [archaeon]